MTIMRVKSRKNIYLVKKIFQKGRYFVLLIRRDRNLQNILACHLYDLLPQVQGDSIKMGRDMNSESGGVRQSSALITTSKDISRPKYKYQTIYLMEDVFFVGYSFSLVLIKAKSTNSFISTRASSFLSLPKSTRCTLSSG